MRLHFIFKLVKTRTSSRPPEKSYKRFSTSKVTIGHIFSVFIFFLELGLVTFSLVLHVILDLGPLPWVKISARYDEPFGENPLFLKSLLHVFFSLLVKVRRTYSLLLLVAVARSSPGVRTPVCPWRFDVKQTPPHVTTQFVVVAVVFFFRYSYCSSIFFFCYYIVVLWLLLL